MLVEFGNPAPVESKVRQFVENGEIVSRSTLETLPGPAVTYLNIPDSYSYVVADAGVEVEVGADRVVPVETAGELATEVMRNITTGDPALTHVPDQEALICAVNVWQQHSTGQPSWVWSDNDPFATLLGAYFGCTVGRPDDVEETHITHAAELAGPTQENI